MTDKSIGLHIAPEDLTANHVRNLSLHETTANFGTLGLYLRLKDTLSSTGLADNPDVMWATQLGLTLHANDKRVNGHYADHLLRVTLRILEHYNVQDPSIIAASMIHDAPEDHAKDIVSILAKEEVEDEKVARYKAFELLTHHVGEEVVYIVQSVTNPLVLPGEDKMEVYERHTRDLVMNKPKPRVLKLSDFTDNAVGNHYTTSPKRENLDAKYVNLYQVHRAGLFMPDSIITGEERLHALQQLTEGHARTLARLALMAEDQ